MAFVNSLPVDATSSSLLGERSRTSAVSSLRPGASSASSAVTPRMKYGDYSYSTDKTKGHVQQYYVDKFRVASDFSKGVPATDADAVLGRDRKGAVAVPTGGIPQPMDPLLLVDMTGVPEDPRVAESKGAVYRWDSDYADPQFAADTFADVEDESVSDSAFAAFRAASQAERGSALAELDAAQKYQIEKIKGGLSEPLLLTMEGKYLANYARLQKIANVMQYSPISGQPQTEIPGIPYLPGIGALDFMPVPGEEKFGAFWAAPTPNDKAEVVYQKPMGASAPELPYNGTPTLEQMQEATVAKGLLPSSD